MRCLQFAHCCAKFNSLCSAPLSERNSRLKTTIPTLYKDTTLLVVRERHSEAFSNLGIMVKCSIGKDINGVALTVRGPAHVHGLQTSQCQSGSIRSEFIKNCLSSYFFFIPRLNFSSNFASKLVDLDKTCLASL